MDSTANGSKKLAAVVSKIIDGAGTPVDVRLYSEEDGGGWAAIVDTEYAALKLQYQYRYNNARIGKRADATWYVAVG